MWQVGRGGGSLLCPSLASSLCSLFLLLWCLVLNTTREGCQLPRRCAGPASSAPPGRCQMGWSKSGLVLAPASSLPGPLGSQEESRTGQQMVGWEEGLPGRRTTVRTDGGLGRGPEPAHLPQPPQGFFLSTLG
jgi:hypothetical protein